MKSYLVRAKGITGLFWGDNIVAAWEDLTGNCVNLWFAYVILKPPTFVTLTQAMKDTDTADCEHGFPPLRCMTCLDRMAGLDAV